MSARKWVARVLLVGAFLFLGINIVRSVFARAPTDANAKDRQTAARVVPVIGGLDERAAVPRGNFIGGNAIIEPADRETHVAALISGKIAKILVKEGQFVKQGAVLVELDHATQDAQLSAAEADVKAAEADLMRTLHGNRHEDVQAAIADAEAASARAELSEGVAQRLTEAARGGGATPDEVDRAVRQAQADKASAATADARRRASIAGSRLEDVLASRARLNSAKARRDQMRVAVDESLIKAPLSGEILQLKFRVGEYYQPGGSEPLVVMGDTRQLRARIDVDERDIAKLRLGAASIIRVPAFPGRDFTGKIVEIGERMGRKNLRTDDPVERNDTKILEVVVLLDPTRDLVVGQQAMGYISEPNPPQRAPNRDQ